MHRIARPLPNFESEAQERRFWESHDSIDHVDWSRAEHVRLPSLRPSTTSISLRLPVSLLERLLPQLHEARQLADHPAIYRVAHTIKSSSASIGALRLSQLCFEVENCIRLEQAGDLDTRVDAMCVELEVVLQALRAWTDGKS